MREPSSGPGGHSTRPRRETDTRTVIIRILFTASDDTPANMAVAGSGELKIKTVKEVEALSNALCLHPTRTHNQDLEI